jgi:glycosyltransferase involved in cell wall biosynthesis
MRLIALMPVRNEAWILGLSMRAALKWCDSVIALDHASTDETPQILADVAAEHPGRVTVLRDDSEGWSEMAHRQRLLDAGRAARGTHFAIVDADEVLTGNLLDKVRGCIETLDAGRYMSVGMFCMWRALNRFRTDGRIWARREDLALAFADGRGIGWHSGGYDHHHRHPHGSEVHRRLRWGSGGVMHLQWASWRRLVAKHARYKMLERVKYPDKPVVTIDRMYSQALDERGLVTKTAAAEWWAPYADLMRHVDLEAVPWQEAECRRLWTAHGAETFRGLDLFGVV